MIAEPLVSVITPVFNAKNYIESTFSSLKKQTIGFSKIEWIAVDNCSEDGSFDFLQKKAKKNKNIKIFQTPANSGSAGLPRNIALANATAPYFFFLDSDDYLDPSAIETLLNIIEYHDVDIASAAFDSFDSYKNIRHEKRYAGKREGIYRIHEQIDEWYPIANPFYTKLFRREIVIDKKLNFNPALRIGEDTLFLFEYMQHIESAWHINQVIHHYRLRPDSATHLINKNYFDNFLFAMNTMKEKLSGTRSKVYFEKFAGASIPPIMVNLLCSRLSDKECEEILSNWFPLLKFVAEINAFYAKPFASSILFEDASRSDLKSAITHFFSIRSLCIDYQAKLDSIFTSRTWQLLSAVRRLKRK